MSAHRKVLIQAAIAALPNCDPDDVACFFEQAHFSRDETPDSFLGRLLFPGIEQEIEGAHQRQVQARWDYETWQDGTIRGYLPKPQNFFTA